MKPTPASGTASHVKPGLTVDTIITAVLSDYGLGPSTMITLRRTKRLAECRHVAMFLIRRHTKRSLPEIGLVMGRRDHTTVPHGVRRIAERLRGDPDLVERVGRIEGRMVVERETGDA